ncbi:hypothetical protein D3C80_1015650 [compost metagenome]
MTNMTKGGITATAAAAAAAITRQLRPAMNMTAAPVSPMIMAEPRSGCLATSRKGTPIMPKGKSSFHDQRASWAE